MLRYFANLFAARKATRTRRLHLEALEARDVPAAFVPNEVLVKFNANAPEPARAKALKSAGADQVEWIPTANVAVCRLHPGRSVDGAIKELKKHQTAVQYSEPNWVYTTQATSTDPYYTNGSLWGMSGTYGSRASAAWAAEATGSSQVYVGVIDEGIQYTHPDLDRQVWTNPYDPVDGIDNDGNGYKDDTRGWDFANNDNTIYDGGTQGKLDDHGTHVSGTIGAEANGAGVVGVNWNVTLISGKFLGRNGGTTANAVKAVDYFTNLKKGPDKALGTADDLNIVATNNSWGGGGSSQALFDAISRANAANILFIAAAGNGGFDGVGDNNDVSPSYPGNYNLPNVISVAAINSAGNLASFSNYGASNVDIGAPGVGIWSTTAYNTYSSYSGTSMATPHVTGAAALFAATHPGATAAQIKLAILLSATPTASLAGKTVTGGRLNVSGFAAISQFAVTNVLVNEAAGTVSVTVTRTGGTSGTASVKYSTGDGTAIAGEDYATATGTLEFAAVGDSKTIVIAILGDAVDETFALMLISPDGALLGATVTI